MSEVMWNALLNGPNPGESFTRGLDEGMARRQRIEEMQKQNAQDNALKALSAGDPNALKSLYAINPQLAAQLENQLFQRGERDRAAQFRQGEAGMILTGGGGIGAASNALMGQPVPPMTAGAAAQDAAPQDGGAYYGAPASAAPSSEAAAAPDPHAALAQLDPHRDSIVKGAAIIRQTNPTDDASWQRTRQAAGAAGVDLTQVPQHFDPQYVQGVVQLADHFAGQGQPASPQSSYSPAEQQAINANPEGFLTFQGKQLAVTKAQLGEFRDLNNTAMQILGGVHDQDSYDAAKQQAANLYQAYGMDSSSLNLPAEYDPQTIHDLQMQGMDTAHQLSAVARENGLSETARYHDESIAVRERGQNIASADRRRGQDKRGNRGGGGGGRQPAPKAPSPTSVVGQIMAKQASGGALTPAEQKTYDEYRAGRGRGGGGRGGSSGVSAGDGAIIKNPQTGQRMQLRNGRWIPIK